uniref:NTP_transferase domain-containing protein n=1 Tax=Rhabditophanes sp. KR3021 TaxID=114890 RepID=A0AC35UII7_9BILA
MVSEFQAVVMAGGVGNRMTNLTNHVVKSSLPIANVPMFWYPLNFLAKNRITDVLLVITDKITKDVEMEMKDKLQFPEFAVEMNIKVISLPQNDEDWGTFKALLHIQSHITRDFIVVSGDFISDVSLVNLLKMHRANQSSVTCLLSSKPVTGTTPGSENAKPIKYRDFIGLNKKDNRLVFMIPEDDFDESSKSLDVFKRFRDVELSANYQDCHVYVMKKYVLDICCINEDINAIKGELLPMLLEQQVYHLDQKSVELIEANNKDVFKEDAKNDKKRFETSESNEANEVLHNFDKTDMLKCYAYIIKPEDGNFTARCNTIASYFETCKSIVPYLTDCFYTPRRHALNVNHLKVHNSLLSETVKFLVADGESGITAINRSVINYATAIRHKTTIADSIVMNTVKIGKGVVIKNSIICPNVTIGDDVELNDCIVTSGYQQITKGKYSNKLFAEEAKEMILDD